MRSMWKVFALSLVIVTLAACAKPTPAPTAVPEVEPTHTGVPPTETPVLPTVTPVPPTPEEVPTEFILPLPSGTPVADWKGVAIIPGALSGEGDDTYYSFTTDKPLEEVQAFYENELVALGWSELAVGEGEEGASILFFTREEQTFTVSIIPQSEGLLYVMLMQ